MHSVIAPLNRKVDADRGVLALRVATLVGIAVLFLLLIPLLNSLGVIADRDVNRLGRYLCFAIVAVGIDLVWGYAGALTLCQAFFFCLGAYCIAMHLSLPQGGGDVRPEYHNIPQFFFFNNVEQLPAFWRPFGSLAFALAAAVLVPGIAALLFGFFIFRSRVKGVYFSIITQALAWAAFLMFSRNEMLLGGTNGLTNFQKTLNSRIDGTTYIVPLYLATCVTLVVVYLALRWITHSRLGRLLVAVRDNESRLYFAGYRPYALKVFAFTVAGIVAAIAGVLYAPQMGIITPNSMRVIDSIFLVLLVAVGGRGRLWGAVVGALVVKYAESMLTSDLPSYWPFILGALFVSVVLIFPQGLIGLWDKLEDRVRLRASIPQVLLASLPIVTVVAFLFAEAMSFMPDALNIRILGVPVKYVVLSLLLGAAAMGERLMRPSAPTEEDAIAPASTIQEAAS